MNSSKVRESYEAKIQATDKTVRNLEIRLNQLSLARLGMFLASIASIYLFGQSNVYVGIGIGLLVLLVFFYLVQRFLGTSKNLAYYKNLAYILQNERDHLDNKGNIYNCGNAFVDADHAYTDDLDIFGKSSLFHYINRSVSYYGNERLASWLRFGTDKTGIESRQAAVLELSKQENQLHWFRATLWESQSEKLEDIAYNIRYLFSKALAFTNSKWLEIYSIAAPYILVLLFIASFFLPPAKYILFAFFILNYFINAKYGMAISRLHELVGKSSTKIKVYSKVLEWIEKADWQSRYLKDLVVQCKSGSSQNEAYKQIARLGKLVQQLDYRLNIVVAIVLNLGFLWDIRVSYRIRTWHETSAETLVKSFEVIGEFESMVSLSTLSINHPDWVFPIVVDTFSFNAVKLGHPLIPDDSRVYNDFHFDSTKTVDVITGSNMAGKSTFLRTLGVNMVLAYAGAPACCENLTLSPVKLISYMRIKDSLNENTSTFKAELNRLKLILELSAATPNAFSLIDEMLRGTNSRDKYLGTKVFIEKLIKQNSAAIIATHDLQVADLINEYPVQVRNFHFDIQTDGTEMYFDYKIKQGECKTFNASILLKQIGLDIGEGTSHS